MEPDPLTMILDTCRITLAHYRHQPVEAIPHIHKVFDTFMESFTTTNNTACKFGCHARCCKNGDVAVSPLEVLYICRVADLSDIKVNIQQFVIHGVKRCPLLDCNDKCGIYSVRPMQCRGYCVPNASKCEQAYGVTSNLATEIMKIMPNHLRLLLPQALLVGIQSRTHSKFSNGDMTPWQSALFPAETTNPSK